jgi:hypothetical protein
MILVIGPRLEGHSVIFLAIQTHLSCRFLLAVDSLRLRRNGSSPQFIDPPLRPSLLSGLEGCVHALTEIPHGFRDRRFDRPGINTSIPRY